MKELVSGVDDLDEIWLQGSSSDQESIDIWLLSKFGSVVGGYGSLNIIGIFLKLLGEKQTSVDDSGGGGNFGGDLFVEELTDPVVDLLSLFRRCGLSGSNSPDRFVSNNNLGPVNLLVNDSLELTEVNLNNNKKWQQVKNNLHPWCVQLHAPPKALQYRR